MARWLELLAKLTVAGGILAWLLTTGRLDLGRIAELNFGFALAAGFALRGLSTLIPLLRWCVLARAAGLSISWMQGLQIGFAGRFFSLVTPGWLGVDAARVYYGVSHDPGQSEAVVASVLLDRLSDLVALAGLAASVFIWRIYHGIELANLAVPVSALVVVLACGSASTHGGPIFLYLRRVAQAFRSLHQNKTALIAATLIALLGHIVGFSGIWFLFQALSGDITYLEVLTLQPLVALVRLVSFAPHGLGIADAVGDIAYGSVGSAIGAEVVFVSRLVTMTVSALCGISFVLPSSPSSRHGS